VTTLTVDHGRATHPNRLLPVFAVRAELEQHSDLAHFDREVDAAIEHAAATGSFARLHEVLRAWLGVALSAKNADQHCRVPFEQRGENLERMIRTWEREHPAAGRP
jgi:hypothetical protein